MLLVSVVSGWAKMHEEPRSFALKDRSQEQVERKGLPPVDLTAALTEDQLRDRNKQHPVPLRIAVSAAVSYTLNNSGTWQTLADGRLWRLRVQTPSAKHMSLGITRFDMPEGAKLWIYDPAHQNVDGPYTARQRNRHGGLWTPIVEGDEINVEVFLPNGIADPALEITRINQGYRGFKSGLFGDSENGCNIDVVCPAGDPYRDQIRAVAVYTISTAYGLGACSGTLLNNTAHDDTPYFLSAQHCVADPGADPASVVLYWNYQSSTCGTHGPGSLADNQTGAILRASYQTSDFALFELDAVPDAAFNVYYAGWDVSGTVPAATVCNHHPMADVKAITLYNNPPGDGTWYGTPDTHWTALASSGLTQEGSSGSCLLETSHNRCIGQLTGGLSEPTTCANPGVDYFGKLSVSWEGGGTSTTRLRDWIDAANTDTLTLDGSPPVTGSVPTVSVSGGPAPLGGTVTLTATVSSTIKGTPLPTGSVTFETGTATLGTASLAAGVATLGNVPVTAANGLSLGGDLITAGYSGDSNFKASAGEFTLRVFAPAVPLLLSLSPDHATAMGTGFTLTVSGANFNSSSVVLWNGGVRTTTLVSSTQMTAAIGAQDIAKQGLAEVSVVNLSPSPGTAAGMPFAIISGNPIIATITGVSIADDYAMTATGADFVSYSVVQWNQDSLSTAYVGPGILSTKVTASEFTSRPAAITVNNPSGTSPGFELR